MISSEKETLIPKRRQTGFPGTVCDTGVLLTVFKNTLRSDFNCPPSLFASPLLGVNPSCLFVGYCNETEMLPSTYVKNTVPNNKMFIVFGSSHGFIGMKRSSKIYSFIYFDYGIGSPLYVNWGDGTNDHSNRIALMQDIPT